MLTRVLSGAVLCVVTVLTLYFGGLWMFGVNLLISMVGLYELYKVIGIHNKALGFTGYFCGLVYYAAIYFGRNDLSMAVLVATLILIMMVYVAAFPKYKSEQAFGALFGFVYVVVMLACAYQTRAMHDGLYTVWLIFICAWGSDTFAYFAGVLFGKHKMTPKLSPKKTIEGFFGGILGAAGVGAIYGAIISRFLVMISEPVLIFAVASAVGAILSVVGDLAASGIKRDFAIKDYGKIIPGHGGILDRFDSVIFTAPAVFWILTLFLN